MAEGLVEKALVLCDANTFEDADQLKETIEIMLKLLTSDR